jgi:hypothetical protein
MDHRSGPKCDIPTTLQVLQALARETAEVSADVGDQAGEGDIHSGIESTGTGAVAYLAMRALLALGRAAEAQAELLTMASAPDAPLQLCMSAIKVRRDGTQAWTGQHHDWIAQPGSNCRLKHVHAGLPDIATGHNLTCRICWLLRKRSWQWCRHWRRCCTAGFHRTQSCLLGSSR